MSESLNLYRLQKLDTQIDRIESRLKEIDQALSDDRRVRKAQSTLKKAEEAANKAKAALKQIEDQVGDTRLKRKISQASLFSGKIKNPKDLQDLQMESEALARYIVKLEDQQLEAMIANESADEAHVKAEKALLQAKGTAAEENASLLGEKTALDEELDKALREKEAVLQGVSEANLALYQKLRKSKRGTAVAAITDGGCSICGQSLTPAEMQTVRSGSNLVFCPSCGRILFSH
ncbi:hypothetical protein JR338_02350 [Chloroflexota bacterium]|nr:hypothetical protein JR338_02350 [Chloroflexota bacterium]